MIDRFNTIVQEDKALSHAFEPRVYECRFASSFVIEQFICLNMIESC